VGDGGAGDNSIYLDADSGSVFLYTAAGAALTASSSGRVGIGTTSPQNLLHVYGPNAGQLLLQNSANGRSFNLYAESTGNLLFVPGPDGVFGYFRYTDGAWLNGSDERLKKDIIPLAGVLDRLLQLRPVSYEFRNAAEGAPRSLGLIAQEVEPLFPEVIGEHSGMKALAYSELVPVTIGAIQELNRKMESENAALREELKRSDAENAELKQRLDALEKIIRNHKPN
jgi:hypothetical protein